MADQCPTCGVVKADPVPPVPDPSAPTPMDSSKFYDAMRGLLYWLARNGAVLLLAAGMALIGRLNHDAITETKAEAENAANAAAALKKTVADAHAETAAKLDDHGKAIRKLADKPAPRWGD